MNWDIIVSGQLADTLPERIAHGVCCVRSQGSKHAGILVMLALMNELRRFELLIEPLYAWSCEILKCWRDNAGESDLRKRIGKRATLVPEDKQRDPDQVEPLR